MHKPIRSIGFGLPLVVALVFSSFSAPDARAQAAGLPSKTNALVQEAVFEVVVKKAAVDSLTYDKPLDWEAVPYAVRKDEYYSIGTAFAISKTELVTAFHVIDLGAASAVYDSYYVRDSQGEVYEVDKAIRGSNERDFLVFTVKNKTFKKYFKLEPNFAVGSQVYSVGNALGEGIIVRNGLVLGTFPEEESGRWMQLKSSADGNPGNSGGPLITPKGKVVGVVVALKDNILYSLPIAALLESPADKLQFRQKLTYNHLLLSNQTTKVYETEVPLPADYKSVRAAVTDRYTSVYDNAMKELFKAAPAYLDGPNNAYFFDSVSDSSFPELAFVDKDDSNWKLSNLKTETFTLPDDGSIEQAKVGGTVLIKVDLPKTLSLAEAISDPKAIMDLILKGLSMERNLGGAEKYRILSFGSPSSVSEYRDAMGRLWIQSIWTVEFADRAFISYILPTPDGFVVLWTYQPTSREGIYEWDMKATCDKTQIAYKGDFPEWVNFLKMDKWVPSFFSDLKVQWSEPDKRISVDSAAFTFSAGPGSLDWTSSSSLFLSPAYYLQDGKLQYGIRKALLQRDVRGRDFVILYKNVKPDVRLGAKRAEAWDALAKARTPFDGKPGINTKDNVGSIGAILSPTDAAAETLYSLYFTMEEPGSEEALLSRFSALRGGILLRP